MSRWFRHYAGMMRDEKLVRVALQAKQPVERVLWLWGAILESAAEINDGGRYDLDTAEAAYFLRADEADIKRVIECFVELGRLSADGVAKWRVRQFQSDTSTDRVRRHRERQDQGNDGEGNWQSDGCNGDGTEVTTNETELKRSRNAPETETNTESEKKVIRGGDRFEDFWKAYPRRKGHNPKHPSKVLYLAALKSGATEDAIIGGALRFSAAEHAKINTEFIPQAPKWLRGRGWEDYPAISPAFRTLPAHSEEWERERSEKIARGESDALMMAQAEKGNGWSIPLVGPQKEAAE